MSSIPGDRDARADANRRIGEAADLGPRHTLTGEPLPPLLAATAAAQHQGAIGAGGVAVIRSFCHRLPDFVDPASREAAEADLARLATEFRPEQAPASGRYPHAQLARLSDCLNPTAPSPTPTAPAGAASPWANKTSTA